MERRVVLHGEKRYDGIIEFNSINGIGNISKNDSVKQERSIWLKSEIGGYFKNMGIHEKVDIDAIMYYTNNADGQPRIDGIKLLNARQGSRFSIFSKKIYAYIFSCPHKMLMRCA